MPTLPYPAIRLWGAAVVVAILALNLAVLAQGQGLVSLPFWQGWDGWTFSLYGALRPAPYILWAQGDPFPWAETYRLITHGYLHGGWDHLAFNMLPFVVLGWLTARRVGALGLLLLYHLLMVIAAAGYLWAMYLSAEGVYDFGNYFMSMAGASGAVHGLGGLWVIWAVQDRAVQDRAAHGATGSRPAIARRIWPAAVWFGFMLAVNIWVYVAMAGAFAWTLHIAGVVAGMALAPFIRQRRIQAMAQA